MAYKGLATAALVLGICSVVFGWVPIIGLIIAIVGLVLGIVSAVNNGKDSSLQEEQKKPIRQMAVAGIVLSAIGIVISILIPLAFFAVLSPDNLIPDKTMFGAPLMSVDNAEITSSGFEVAFLNNGGFGVKIPLTTTVASEQCTNAVLSGTYNGQQITPETIIPNGGSFLLKWSCNIGNLESGDYFKATVNFDYIDPQTTFQRTEMGTIVSRMD